MATLEMTKAITIPRAGPGASDRYGSRLRLMVALVLVLVIVVAATYCLVVIAGHTNAPVSWKNSPVTPTETTTTVPRTPFHELHGPPHDGQHEAGPTNR